MGYLPNLEFSSAETIPDSMSRAQRESIRFNKEFIQQLLIGLNQREYLTIQSSITVSNRYIQSLSLFKKINSTQFLSHLFKRAFHLIDLSEKGVNNYTHVRISWSSFQEKRSIWPCSSKIRSLWKAGLSSFLRSSLITQYSNWNGLKRSSHSFRHDGRKWARSSSVKE